MTGGHWQPHEDRPTDAFYRVYEGDARWVCDVWLGVDGQWIWTVTRGDTEKARAPAPVPYRQVAAREASAALNKLLLKGRKK